ncbi:unnamed protein product [Rodentolepis nana]|uniref:Uncharacterized protein n=1 Tax=Rodentolepis nana TaxID=102285 RepID=A0A0R3TM34_RODNA|nr:unnamed protein product [Rodentolepis nana]
MLDPCPQSRLISPHLIITFSDAQSTNDIRRINDASNVVTDTMSRRELNQICHLDLQALASEQKSDPEFMEITTNPTLIPTGLRNTYPL